MENKNVYNILSKVNVNDKSEKKNGSLTYLSWSFAWDETLKKFPNANYEIIKFDNNLPYLYDPDTGYMVFTRVTIEGITREMFLPVIDGANKAMKNKAYTYKTKYAEKSVEPASMFDINKAIMRCLVKNLAMFGLGIYIYAGEDLPTTKEPQNVTDKQFKEHRVNYESHYKKLKDLDLFLKDYKVSANVITHLKTIKLDE